MPPDTRWTNAPICYLGDDHVGAAAAYLAGVMAHAGLPFEHVPSTASPPADFGSRQYAAYVLSDYPAARIDATQWAVLVDRVRQGSGLVMIGGWESFHGRRGEYHRTPVADLVPVEMLDHDDRRNFAQPCLVRVAAEHPVLAGLPWETPPSIGGLNVVRPKTGSQTVLTAVPFSVRRQGDGFLFTPGTEVPLLVLGRSGKGRTAALATDVAPHWVGGLVDWGDRRVVQEVGAGFIEVGTWYARFFENLLRWARGEG